MNDWEESVESSTFEFIEKLERVGFKADGRTLTGAVGVGADSVWVQVVLPAGFPFSPPVVSPPSDFPRSWHRERNGAMCLYTVDARQNQPWLDVEDFLALVARWIIESRTGWLGDFPNLDLERYFPQADAPLVVYGDLDQLSNRFVQFRSHGHILRLTGPGAIPKKKGGGKDRSFGYVTEIGTLDIPPVSWDDIRGMIPDKDVSRIERGVNEGRFSYLIVRYMRGGVDSAVVLAIGKNSSDASGAFNLRALRSASEAQATLMLRAGLHAKKLSDSRVAVVGVGAVGSVVCDLLSRSGVGHITAYDPDIVRPGNLIRHLADTGSVGLSKPDAVKRTIESRAFNSTHVVSIPAGLSEVREVFGVFTEHDLVIDASASGDVTPVLATAAQADGHHIVSVCLQEEGRVVRVDIIPPIQGEQIEETRLGPPPSRDELHFEAGCGDPVSQTPSYAVYEAAALAARHSIGLLIGEPISCAGTVRDYR